jgi:phosphoglycolate phosphatase-like HAD superfamily hydrolase
MARTLVLDIDGTLVDSNDAHARAWVKAFNQNGFDVPFEQVRPLIGMGGDQLVPRLTGVHKGDSGYQALADGWKTAFEHELPGIRPFGGTRQMVQTALETGWTLVVATSGEPDLADKLLKLADVADLLPDRVSSQDAQASKPEPDLMYAALQKAGVWASEAWILGDTKYDIEAAHDAGMKCAAVSSGGSTGLEGADTVFADLAEVTQWLKQTKHQTELKATGPNSTGPNSTGPTSQSPRE